MNTKISAEIPLTPDEEYNASQMVGRSLFSALQLAREQELRKRKALESTLPQAEDDQVLRIPIPETLMPHKAAAFGEPAYSGIKRVHTIDTPYSSSNTYEPEEGKGLLSHFKRNIGKYVGAGLGGLAGGGLGYALTDLPIGTVSGAMMGSSLGGHYDRKQKEDYVRELQETGQLNHILEAFKENQKMASHESAKFSVIENPDGTLEHKMHPAHTKGTGGAVTRNKGSSVGALIGAGLGGGPGMAAGYAAGSLADSNSAYNGIEFSKTIEHLDGSKEHVFEIKGGDGVGAHIKRNLGKYLGLVGGSSLRKAMGKSVLNPILPAAGLFLGHALDKQRKETAMDEASLSEKGKADMLSDIQFKQQQKKDKLGSDGDPGMFASAFARMNRHPVRMLTGGQQGFGDAKKEYYMMQKKQIQEELMHAQKEYIDTLSRIKSAAVSDTPCVDAFCNGLAHSAMFGKTGSYKDVSIEDDSLSHLMDDVKRVALKPVRGMGGDAAVGALLNTGAGTAYLTYLMRKKMREEPESYAKEHLPTRVELQPYVA
jgi:hypothetical protein